MELTRRGALRLLDRTEAEGEEFCCRDDAAAAVNPREERRVEKGKRRKAEENRLAVLRGEAIGFLSMKRRGGGGKREKAEERRGGLNELSLGRQNRTERRRGVGKRAGRHGLAKGKAQNCNGVGQEKREREVGVGVIIETQPLELIDKVEGTRKQTQQVRKGWMKTKKRARTTGSQIIRGETRSRAPFAYQPGWARPDYVI